MAGVGALPVHQVEAIESGRQRIGREGIAPMGVHPVMQSPYVKVGAGRQVKGRAGGSAAAATLQLPFLPMQKNLIVFQHFVVAEMLEPNRPQSQQPARQGGAELEGEAGEQPAFAPADGRGINHGEDAAQALGAQVMNHQSRGREGGVLAAETALARSLLPEGREALWP